MYNFFINCQDNQENEWQKKVYLFLLWEYCKYIQSLNMLCNIVEMIIERW